MKRIHFHYSYIGLVIVGISLFLSAINAPYFLLFFLFIVPGFFFGFYLKDDLNIELKEWKKNVLVIISGLLYMVCFWMLKIGDTDDSLQNALRLMYASCFGSVVLSLTYQLVFLNKASIALTFYILIFVGILSAIPGAITMYFTISSKLYHENYNKLITLLQFAGMLSIFPLWQASFVWVMNSERFKPVSQKTATAP